VNYSPPKYIYLNEIESDLYVSLRKTGSPDWLYYYSPAIHVGNSTTLDNAFVTSMKAMTKNTMTSSFSKYTATVYGKYPGEKKLQLFSITGDATVTTFYPMDLVNAPFESFITKVVSSDIVNGINVTQSFSTESMTSLPAQINELPAALVSIEKSLYPSLQLTLSGQADYVVYTMYTANRRPATYDYFWLVFSPFSTNLNIILPPIDTSIVNIYDHIELRLIESEFITSYKQVLDYCMNEAPPFGDGAPKFTNNSMTKTYVIK
jgi:hypothetical protein